MRVALIADIHANLAALEAVLAFVDTKRPDAVIVAGDVINRGPRPRECLEIIDDRRVRAGWHVIRGNHEDYVISEAAPRPDRPGWETKLCQHSIWTYQHVRGQLPAFSAWPERLSVAGDICCMHASARGNRAGLYPRMTDDVIRDMIVLQPGAFCVGHTHVPFTRQIGDTLVVNAGAVGMPFDGDTRASLALLERVGGAWRAEHVRLKYDRDRTDADYRETGYLVDGGPMVQLIYDEFRLARPRLGEWHNMFEKMVRDNHITIEASVEEMLTSP